MFSRRVRPLRDWAAVSGSTAALRKTCRSGRLYGYVFVRADASSDKLSIS